MGNTRTRSRRAPWRAALAATLLGGGLAIVAATASSASAPGAPPFELDAAVEESGTPTALYPNGQLDWVNTAGAGADPNGLFELGADGDCYNSSVVPAGVSGYAATFICDGNSDSKFSGKGSSLANEPELNIVTPSGKTLDPSWPIAPGNNPGKSDFSHAYAAFTARDDTACDADATSDLWMITGAHRGDNEGTQFWGVELLQVRPEGFDKLAGGTGEKFDLVFDRQPGDVLLIFDNQGNEGVIAVQVAVWDGTTYVLQPDIDLCGDGVDPASGFTNGDDNPDDGIDENNEIEAPPWNVPACDPTSDGGANSCRLASGTADGATEGFHLLPERDFFEAMVNLSAFGVGDQCFSTLIFTSRSSNTVNADLKDVAAANPGICGASISIEGDDVNEVGDQHTFTVTVGQQIGSTTQGISGVAFELLTDADTATTDNYVTLANGTDTDPVIDTDASTCDDGTDSSGQCTIVFNTSTATTITGTATATVDVFGSTFTVATDGTGSNSGPAVKDYVDATITIAPDDVNEVNDQHVFTITAAPLGNLTPSAVAITPSVSPPPDSQTDTCASPTAAADGSYTCTITINGDDVGTFTANASVDFTFDRPTGSDPATITVTRSTAGNSGPGGSGSAVKDYVDATITIAPDATNSIGVQHVFTITATRLGSVAPSSVTITPTVSGGYVSDTCAAPVGTDPVYTCEVAVNSSTPTTITANASVDFTFDRPTGSDPATITVTRSTAGDSGPGGSGSATKVYVDGSIVWEKVDDAGNHVGGAVFEVCRTSVLETEGEEAVPVEPPGCFTVADDVDGTTDAGDVDLDPRPGYFELDGLQLGSFTITETTPPLGYEADPGSEIVTITFDDPDTEADETAGNAGQFVNPRLFKVIVLVCQESDSSLYSSSVTFDGETKDSLAENGVNDELCSLGGAAFGGKTADDVNPYTGSVTIGSEPVPPPTP